MIEAGLVRAPPVFAHAPAGESDHDGLVPERQLPHPATDLGAVHVWQPDVAEYDRWPLLLDQRQAVGSGVRDGGQVTPTLQRKRQNLRRIPIVLDDQDLDGPGT